MRLFRDEYAHSSRFARKTLGAAFGWLVIAIALFVLELITTPHLTGDARMGAFFFLRLGQASGIGLCYGLTVVALFFARRRLLGWTMLVGAFVLLLWICGFGDLFPLPPITHREESETIRSSETALGVIVERVEPWIERPARFVVLHCESDHHYRVEEVSSPPAEELVPGTRVTVLVERFGRFSYSSWLLGLEEPVVRATRVYLRRN